MQMGMVGLGRMGADMVRRLLAAGHQCVVFDQRAESVAALAADGATPAPSLQALIAGLQAPRVVWLMVPAAITPALVNEATQWLQPGDILIDGGNSDYREAIRQATELKLRGIHFLDVGTSGGVWGKRNGYCLMIGGEPAAVAQAEPLLAALAPGADTAAGNESDKSSPAQQGYLHCGPSGAGHFVKMVHNGIEYGLMAAYAEGFNLLAHAGRGLHQSTADAETAPLATPEHYQYQLDVAAIAEVWRHGSVVRSWLLDLAAEALHMDPQLENFHGRVSDSGEGRWTLRAGIDLGVPMPALAAALFDRFTSQGEALLGNKLLSAMRQQFGGHAEKAAIKTT
jgi:6-phosphogluconate dehydrogenase